MRFFFIFFIVGFMFFGNANFAEAAITFVNKGTLQGTTTTTDAAATLPASTQTDDILVVSCFVRNTGDTMDVSGYTIITQVDTTTGSWSWWWKRHDGSEGTATCNKSASADSSAIQYAFRGVRNSGNPWDVLGTPEADAAANSFTVTALSSLTPDSLILVLTGYEDDDSASVVVSGTDPAAYTENYTEVTTSTSDSAHTAAYEIRSDAGSTGTITVNHSVNPTTDQQASVVMSFVPATITLSGTCDAFDQTTDCGDTGTIRAAINGVLSGQTQATVAGTWTMSIPTPASGASVVVWVDGAGSTDLASAVTLYDGSGDIDLVRLYKEHVTIGTDSGSANSGQSLVNTNLDDYDTTNDADVFYDILSAGTCETIGSFTGLCVDGSNTSSQEELLILTGNTYTPGGSVQSENIEVVGTFVPGANTVTVQGSGTPLVISGTLTEANSTFVYSNASSPTIANDTYNSLTISGTISSGTQTATVAGTFSTTGTFTPAAGTITVNGGGTISNSGTLTFYNLTTACSATSVTANTSFSVAGVLTNGATCTLAPSSGTITMNSGSSIANSGTSLSFTNLTLASSAGTISTTGSFAVTGTLTVNSGATLSPAAASDINTAAGTSTLTGSGTVIVSKNATDAFIDQYLFNTRTLTNLVVDYSGGGSQLLSNTTYTGGLKISGSISTGANSATVGTSLNVTGTFTPTSGTITMNNSSSISNSGTLTFFDLTIAASAAVTSSSSFTIAGDLAVGASGSFTGTSGTITFSGTGKATSGTVAIANVSISGTLTNNGALTVSTSLAGAGTLTNGAADTLNIGFATEPSITTLTATASGNIVNYTAAAPNCKVTTYDILNFTGSGSVTCAVTTVTNDINLSGTVSWTTGANLAVTDTVTVGNGTTLIMGGTFTLTVATLNVGGGSSGVFTGNAQALGVSGTLTIGAGATFTSTSGTLTIGNDFTDAGTFTHNSGTVVFDTASEAQIDGNSTVFYNFTVDTDDKVVKFKQGETVRFNGLLTLTGSAGNNNVILDSIDGSGQWTIYHSDSPAATESVDYVTVNHSTCHASATTITNTNTTDGGTNVGTCWSFSVPIVISGSTDMGIESNVIKVSINGGAADSATGSIAGDNTWTITPAVIPTIGQVIVVFIDGHGDSTESTAVGKYDGTGDMTGMVLNTNVLSIGSGDDQSLTVANLDVFDCNSDEDVMYAASATALDVQGCSNSYDNETIQIESGDTLTIDSDETLTSDNATVTGTLTKTTTGVLTLSGNLSNAGTFNGGSGAISVAGDFAHSGGVFTSTSGILNLSGSYTKTGGTFTHNSGTVTLDTGSTATLSSTANISFYNITIATPNKIVKFLKHTTNVPTFSIYGQLAVTGSVGNNVHLESSSPGDQWMVYFNAPQTGITFAMIRDAACGASSQSVTYNGTNSGGGNNGSCWNIGNVGADGTQTVTSVESGSGGGIARTGGGYGSGGSGDGGVEGGGGGGNPQGGGGQGGGGGGGSP